MRFYMPAKIYQELQCVANHAAEIAALGTKALIVTGPHSAQANGSYDDVCAALDSCGVDHVLFNEVEENPSTDTVMRGRDLGLAGKCDFVIGIGGGSPMDASKAIALMIRHADWGVDKLYEAGNPADTVPVVCIPTTCGTGSEATAVSVLTRPAIAKKGSIPYKIFPMLSLVDGRYLRTASHRILADTAIDALAHMYESYINTGATEYSRMLVDRGLNVWKRSRDVLLGRREATDADRMNMMLASTLAGMAIAQDGTGIPHGLSYSLTLKMHLAHGIAVGFFQAGYLREADPDDAMHLLSAAGFRDLDELDCFYRAVCDVPEISDELLADAVDAVISQPSKIASCPYSVDRETLERIAGLRK